MTTLFIILFFASLCGILILFGKKLSLLRAGNTQATAEGSSRPPLPDWGKIKEATQKHAKRYGYAATVATIRTYVRSENYLKSKAKTTGAKIKTFWEKKNGNGQIIEPQEVNKFLKMIGDYKQKIQHLKHKIREEEEGK